MLLLFLSRCIVVGLTDDVVFVSLRSELVFESSTCLALANSRGGGGHLEISLLKNGIRAGKWHVYFGVLRGLTLLCDSVMSLFNHISSLLFYCLIRGDQMKRD